MSDFETRKLVSDCLIGKCIKPNCKL